jgi:ketosteroid isomerase-like protein
MTARDDVLETLEDYADAYCAKDIKQLMSVFDGGEDISLIGTGADELCSGQSAVQAVFVRNFAEATATRFEWHWKHVTVVDDFAVVAITLTIHLDTPDGKLQVPIRWTVSLIRKSGRWFWLHRHASAAAMSQEEGTAYPVSHVE